MKYNFGLVFLHLGNTNSYLCYTSRGRLAQSGEHPPTNSAIRVRFSKWVNFREEFVRLVTKPLLFVRDLDLFQLFSEEQKITEVKIGLYTNPIEQKG